MKLKFNLRKFYSLFSFLMLISFVAVFAGGCTSAWLSAVSGLLPGILAAVNAVVSLVAALEGKTVPVGLAATFQKWETNIADLIAQAQTILAEIKQNATATVLQQFQGVMTTITSNLQGILTDLNVTDSSTVAKITGFINLAIAAASAVIGLIPMAISKLNAPKAELEHYDKMGAAATVSAVNLMKETYLAIRNTPTENLDVNAALAELPPSI